jgi:hypothetical protein
MATNLKLAYYTKLLSTEGGASSFFPFSGGLVSRFTFTPLWLVMAKFFCHINHHELKWKFNLMETKCGLIVKFVAIVNSHW